MLIGGAPALLVSCEVIAIADGEASLASEWSLFRASRREMKADGRCGCRVTHCMQGMMMDVEGWRAGGRVGMQPRTCQG